MVDNSEEILGKLKETCEDVMLDIAIKMEAAVQYEMLYGYNDVHYLWSGGKPHSPHTEIVGETENLYNSITGTTDSETDGVYEAIVGTDTDYGIYMHEGTAKVAPRPFLQDGIEGELDEYKQMIEDALTNISFD